MKLLLKLLFVSIGLVITYIAIVWFQLKNPTTYHGTCEDPQENIVWFYQSDTPLFPFDRDYCGYCDASIGEEDLLQLAISMDARNPATMYPNQKVASQHMIPFISLGEISQISVRRMSVGKIPVTARFWEGICGRVFKPVFSRWTTMRAARIRDE